MSKMKEINTKDMLKNIFKIMEKKDPELFKPPSENQLNTMKKRIDNELLGIRTTNLFNKILEKEGNPSRAIMVSNSSEPYPKIKLDNEELKVDTEELIRDVLHNMNGDLYDISLDK